MIKRWWWALLVIGIWLGGPIRPVHAEGAGFTVTPVLPKNQIGGNTGWFNLLVVPGQQQALTVTVANQSTSTKQLHLTLTNAYTQDNGQVGYAPNSRHDPSAVTQLTAIGSKPIDIELAAHTGKQVTFQVTPPAHGFPGQILGAIYVQDRTQDKTQSSDGFAIANEFAMVVAVQLQTSTQVVAPALKLNSVKPDATSVVARIQNTQARLFGKMTLTSKVVNKATKQTVLTQKDTNYQMAPNSYLDYHLLPKKPLAAGKYTATIVATAGKYRWTLTRDFQLTAQAAAKITPPEKQHPQTFNWWLLSPIVLLSVLLLGIWLGRRHKKGRE